MPINTSQCRQAICVGLALLFCTPAFPAELSDTNDACMLNELKLAEDNTTVAELRSRCALKTNGTDRPLILERIERERAAERVGTVLTPLKQNYLMPASYLDNPNDEPYRLEFDDVFANEQLDRVESKFQLSMKFRLASGLLLRDDAVHAGFTILSFWQVYNRNISAPFRETNYEPELFWTVPIRWRPFGIDASLFSLGFSHQSNGRGGTLSRSWNRLYTKMTWEKGNFVFDLEPWWRIPEDEKNDPLDAKGDDNPDIERFMGHFEFTSVYKRDNHEFSLMLRNNLRSNNNKGAVQLDWTFPLWRRLRGYAQYFNGYGESLIDYNASIERIGIGVLLTNRL